MIALISLIVSALSLTVAVLSLLRDFFGWGPNSWKPEYSQRIRRGALIAFGVGVAAYAVLQYFKSADLARQLEVASRTFAEAQAQAQATQTAQSAIISNLEGTINPQATALAEALATQTHQATAVAALEEKVQKQSQSALRAIPVSETVDELVPPEFFDRGVSRWQLGKEWRESTESGNGYLCGKSAPGQYISVYPKTSPDINVWSVMSDYVLEVDVKPISFSSKGACEILFRKNDSKSDFYGLYLKPAAVTLFRCSGGSCNNPPVADAQANITSGEWHTVFVQARGAEILVLLDGRQILRRQAEDNPYRAQPEPQGRGGFAVGPEAECCFDNIRVLKVQR